MRFTGPAPAVFAISLTVAFLGGVGSTLVGVCGPFADVSDAGFCPFVLEIFTLGITTGTTPTTYDPAGSVSRLQMAAIHSREVDGMSRRESRRASLDRFWTPQGEAALGLTTVGPTPTLCRSDGEDVWVTQSDGTISRVRASDGKLLETWTGADGAFAICVAMGRVFAAGGFSGNLYRVDPSQPAGAVTAVATGLGSDPRGIAFDGARIWIAANSSVSIVTPGAAIPWTVTTVTSGFSTLRGALYDGANVWVAAYSQGALLRLDSAGAILQTVTVDPRPEHPIFDGTNIWAPCQNGDSVAVVRASSGALLRILTGNGLGAPLAAAFDGERVLVTNFSGSVSLWKAADLSPLGSVSAGIGSNPLGACSDGLHFWVALGATSRLARF
jgi:hypothetical protein